MSRDPANAGAVAFERAGDPNIGEFSDAVVLKKFGDVPEDLSAVTMVLLLRDDREPRLDLPCRRATLLGSSTSSTSPVSCATAMQRFGSDGSNSGHGGCALETALLDRRQSLLRPAFEAAPPVASRAAGEQSRLVSRDRAHQVESKDGRDVPRQRRARRTASPAGANDSSAVVENRARSGGPNRRRKAMALRRNRPA